MSTAKESPRSTSEAASAPGMGNLKISHYYQLPDDSVIPIDPNNPDEARKQLPGPVLFSLPDNWEPAADSERLQDWCPFGYQPRRHGCPAGLKGILLPPLMLCTGLVS